MKKISLKTNIDKNCVKNLLQALPSNGTFTFSNTNGDFPLIRDILGLVFSDLPAENLSPFFGYFLGTLIQTSYVVRTTEPDYVLYNGSIYQIYIGTGGMQITFLRSPDYYTYCVISWSPHNNNDYSSIDFTISNRWVLEHIANIGRDIGLDISEIDNEYYSYQIIKRASSSNLVTEFFKLGFSYQDYDDNNIITQDTVFNTFSNVEFEFLNLYYTLGSFSYSLASERSVDGTFSSSSSSGLINISKPQTIVNTYDVQPASYSLIIDYVTNYRFDLQPQSYLSNLNFQQFVYDNLDILNECCSNMKNGESEEMNLNPIVDVLTRIDNRLHVVAEVEGIETDVNITEALIDVTESLEDTVNRPIINTNEDLSPWSAV